MSVSVASGIGMIDQKCYTRNLASENYVSQKKGPSLEFQRQRVPLIPQETFSQVPKRKTSRPASPLEEALAVEWTL